MALIDSLFHTTEAKKIKSIPLPYQTQNDVLYWPMCIDGSYSVKIGYRAMCEEDNHAENTSSNVGLSKRILPKLWKLKVPTKVKSFYGEH